MHDLTSIGTILASILTAVTGYFIGRRKTRAEAAGLELSNVEHAITIWRSLAEDLNGKVQHLSQELEDMRVENRQLKFEIQSLNKRIHEIHG